jgi:hypothetical protein
MYCLFGLYESISWTQTSVPTPPFFLQADSDHLIANSGIANSRIYYSGIANSRIVHSKITNSRIAHSRRWALLHNIGSGIDYSGIGL